jgi:YhcH/YjgK/YiaL family protein
MIYDRLENAGRYRGIAPVLDELISYLEEHDVQQLPEGRTELDGERLLINVMKCTYRTLEEAEYEVHRDYADVQVSFTGDESLAVAQSSPEPERDRETLLYGKGEAPQVVFPLMRGWFLLLWPGEGHAPGIGCGQGRKMCAKLRMTPEGR